MVVNDEGRFLGRDEQGATYVTETISDDLMWRVDGEHLEHARSSVILEMRAIETDRYELTVGDTPLAADGHGGTISAPYTIVQGPERLPSEYLAHLTKTVGYA